MNVSTDVGPINTSGINTESSFGVIAHLVEANAVPTCTAQPFPPVTSRRRMIPSRRHGTGRAA